MKSHPIADILSELLSLVITEGNYYDDLIELSENMLSKQGLLRGANRTKWLTIGFLLNPEKFKARLTKYSKKRSSVVWEIKTLVSDFLKDSNITGNYLNEYQLETLITICGNHFEDTDYPSGGRVGRNNKWDASEFIKNLTNKLSAIPTKLASDALERIGNNKNLISYQDYLLHSLAKQQRVFSETNYHQPDWSETLNILSNHKPFNNPDLYALVQDHLRTVQKELVGSNTDLYKRFWRHGQQGKMQEPDIEDLCRDRLIEVIKPRLSPFGLNTERELDMANHKRADIAVFNNSLKLPLELKRDTHPDVWTALHEQLKRQYSIDPNASGNGLYVVFWFGIHRKGRMPNPPKGINKPASAIEMENSLKQLINKSDRNKLDALVLDCSLPIPKQ